jgi:hypothetical protein
MKDQSQRLLARRPDVICLSDFEQGQIGPDLFRAASRMRVEGLAIGVVAGTGKSEVKNPQASGDGVRCGVQCG